VVARRLGVAPATLRTWARRYELGPSRHTAGSHRRYTAEDFARLVVMRRLTHEGVPPGEAARVALGTAAESLDGVGRAEVGLLEPRDWDRAAGDGASPYLSLARVVPLQDARRIARGLHRAAVSMDARGVADLIRRQISVAGVVATWDDVVVPVLETLGRRWEATGDGVEVEQLVGTYAPDLLWYAGGMFDPARPHRLHHVGMLQRDCGRYDELCETGFVTGCSLPFTRIKSNSRNTKPALLAAS
jgi:hypothetical protein